MVASEVRMASSKRSYWHLSSRASSIVSRFTEMAPGKNFDRLQNIMNFAARVIFGRRKFYQVSGLRDSLG